MDDEGAFPFGRRIDAKPAEGRASEPPARAPGAEGDAPVLETLPLAGHSLEAIERAAIKQTLVQLRGNKVQAARSLGIAVSTLYEKLKKYGI